MFVSNAVNPRIPSYGTGSPEGVLTQAVGNFYVQTDAAAATSALWYKATGTGNTGWLQIVAAPLASPTFTGTPAAPTAGAGTSTTQLATTAFVTTADNLKAPLASPTFTGTPAAPTAAANTNSTQIATTAYVQGELTDLLNGVSASFDTLAEIATELNLKAPLASPTFTGTPSLPTGTTATTQSAADNSTKLATTAYADRVGAKQAEVLVIAVSDETTAITTGTAKVTFRMPFAMTLTSVRASLTTVSSSGNPAIDVNEAGASIFSTTLTIDSSEKTSTTAATPAVISDASLADDAEMTIDIDTAGTGATGLKVYLIGTRT